MKHYGIFLLILCGGVLTSNAYGTGSLPDFKDNSRRVIIRVQQGQWFQSDLSAYLWNDRVYLPLLTLFDHLSVKATYNAHRQTVYGFFLSDDHPYRIDMRNLQARHKSMSFRIRKEEFIASTVEVYIDLTLLNRLFNLGLHFDPGSMRVRIDKRHQFPSMLRKERREQAEATIRRSRTRSLNRPILTAQPSTGRIWSPGLIDWSIRSGLTRRHTYGYASLHQYGYLWKGDYRLRTSLSSQYRTQFEVDGMWRRVFPHQSFVKQLKIGHTLETSYSLGRSFQIDGLLLTNRSPYRNRHFSEIQLRHIVPANRQIGLYHNSELIGYRNVETKTPVQFDIPLGYGSHQFISRMYGAYGEYQEESRWIHIPRNMIRPQQWRYSMAVGRVTNRHLLQNNSSLGTAITAGYGVNSSLTILSAGEYAERGSIKRGVVKTIWNPGNRHILSAQLDTHGESLIAWQFRNPGKWGFSGEYQRESVAGFYVHDGIRNFAGRWHGTLWHNWKAGEVRGITAIKPGIFTNENNIRGSVQVSTRAYWKSVRLRWTPRWDYTIREERKTLRAGPSELSASFRLFKRNRMKIGTHWCIKCRRVEETRVELSRRAGRWWFSAGASWQRRSRGFTGMLTIQTDLQAFTGSMRSRVSSDSWSMDHRMEGSVWFEGDKQELQSGARGWKGEGITRFAPFLDSDKDGVKDQRERWLKKDNIRRVKTGSKKQTAPQTYSAYAPHTTRLTEVMTSSYMIPEGQKTVRFRLYPNIENRVPVPMTPTSSISGNVTFEFSSEDQRHIYRNLLNKEWPLVLKAVDYPEKADTIRTLPSGRFFKNRIQPGDYVLQWPSELLRKYNLTTSPSRYKFSIGTSREDRFMSGWNFKLVPRITIDQGKTR